MSTRNDREFYPVDYGWNGVTWNPVLGDQEAKAARDAFAHQCEMGGWIVNRYDSISTFTVKGKEVTTTVYGCLVRKPD